MTGSMRDAVICEPLRTPVGRMGGALREIPAEALAATVLRALVSRTGLDPSEVDDVILGQGYPNGEAPAIGRVAALDAGFPVESPGRARCSRSARNLTDPLTPINLRMKIIMIHRPL